MEEERLGVEERTRGGNRERERQRERVRENPIHWFTLKIPTVVPGAEPETQSRAPLWV